MDKQKGYENVSSPIIASFFFPDSQEVISQLLQNNKLKHLWLDAPQTALREPIRGVI